MIHYWSGGKIIPRDASINEGVYLGGNEREAIVVDDTRESTRDVYDRVFRRVEDAAREHKQRGVGRKNVLLNAVYDVTRDEMSYDEAKVERILDELLGKEREDKKIELTVLINDHVGVCRHQVLLVGYLIERLIRQGNLRGCVSIDRNAVPGIGAHTWVRYTSHSGKVFILDTSLGYIGPLEGSEKVGGWDYRRPEDPRPASLTSPSPVF